eukprot:g895.t1
MPTKAPLPKSKNALDESEAFFRYCYYGMTSLIFGNEEKGKQAFETIESQNEGHCFDLHDLINNKTKDESLETELEKEMAKWNEQEAGETFKIPPTLAVRRTNVNLSQVRDLLWKREVLHRRRQMEQKLNTLNEHESESTERQHEDMSMPFQARPFVFIKGTEMDSEMVLQMISELLMINKARTDFEFSASIIVNLLKDEEDLSLFDKVERLVSTAPYKTPYSTIAALKYDQPIEEDAQWVDAVMSLATSVKDLLHNYEDFLSSSKIYHLCSTSVDTNLYQQEIEKIREEQATIPTIINVMLDQVCQFIDLNRQPETNERRLLSSQCIHQALSAVKHPKELRIEYDKPQTLDCIFLHHNDEDRARGCGLPTGCIHWIPWSPEGFSSDRIRESFQDINGEQSRSGIFSLQGVLQWILSGLPDRVQEEQKANFKTRRHLEYLNPVVLEQVMRDCDLSDMLRYEVKLQDSQWRGLVYLHDLEHGTNSIPTTFKTPPTLHQFQMDPEKHQGPFYDLMSKGICKKEDFLEEIYPEDVFVKSNDSSCVLTKVSIGIGMAFGFTLVCFKGDLCFSFQGGKQIENGRLSLTYKTQTIVCFGLNTTTTEEQNMEVTFTRADGMVFTILDNGKIKVNKPRHFADSFSVYLDALREGQWLEVFPEGFIVMDQGRSPPKILLKNGGIWTAENIDGFSGNSFTDKSGKRFFHLNETEKVDKEQETWYELEALETTVSDLTEKEGCRITTREDFFMLKEFPDGTESFSLSNGIIIMNNNSESWSFFPGTKLPQMHVSKEKINFEPCPEFKVEVNITDRSISIELPNQTRVLAKQGVVVTSAACRAREKCNTESSDALSNLLDYALSNKEDNTHDVDSCFIEGLLMCDLTQKKCALSHDKELKFYCNGLDENKKSEPRYFDPKWTDPIVLFVSSYGDGFEILSYSKAAYCLKNTPWHFEEICTELYEHDASYMGTFLIPEGSRKHIILRRYCANSQVDEDASFTPVQNSEIALPSLKRPSEIVFNQLMKDDAILPANNAQSFQLSPPVLLFREIIETTLTRDEHKQCSSQIRLPQTDSWTDVRAFHEDPGVKYVQSIMEAKERYHQEQELIKKANEELKKEWRPWTVKTGRFDQCPKVPEAGKLLNYFDTEEGIIALESSIKPPHSQIQGTMSTNKTKASSAGRSICHGVYISNDNEVNKGRQSTELFLSPSNMDFGMVSCGERVYCRLMLTNLTPTPIRFALPVPNPPLTFRAVLGPVAAGMSRVINVTFEAKQEGKHIGEVWIKSELNTLKFTYSATAVKV